jgi:metallo-beta-lactamase family protein
LWKTVRFHEDVQIGDGVVVHYTPVGHILGAGAVHFKRGGKELVCSGDIGNSPDVLLPAPESIKGADYVVMESVYGDRLHDDRDVRHDILARLITEASDEGRTLLIPCFAVHRAQSILFEIHNMVHHGKAPALPVYLDSPLAIQTTDIYRNSINLFKPEVQQEGEHLFDFPKLQIIKRGHDSAAIDQTPGPKIIIAGSGMSVGGRVISHERALLSDRKTTLLFVGYQAPGTLGRRIQDGQRKVRIADEWIPIRASVETIHGYSGHADRDGLMAFAESAGDSLKKVFVIMGEPRASQFLAQRIHDFLSKDSDVPLEHETVTIDL